MVSGRWAAVAGFLAISELATGSNAVAREQDTSAQPVMVVRVRIDNQAGVDATVLRFAKARANQVFASSRVHIDWIEETDASSRRLPVPFTVMIMADGHAKRKAVEEGLQDDVIGQGAPVAGRAYIYFNRMVESVHAPRDTIIQLGDVLAHELGHLLLPPGHSSAGIMRASVDSRTRNLQSFTDAQTRAIRTRLSKLPVSAIPSAVWRSPGGTHGQGEAGGAEPDFAIEMCVYNHAAANEHALKFADAHAESSITTTTREVAPAADPRRGLYWLD